MRKIILSVITIILCLSVCFAGCSCNQRPPIAYKNLAFDNGLDAKAGYKEVCNYSVEYNPSFNSTYAKSSALKDDVITFSFSNGKLTTVLEALPSLPSNISSDIINTLPSNAKTIYKFSYDFSIDAEYSDIANNKSKVYNDTISSVVYFCSANLSFAPIYSSSQSRYSTVSYFNNNFRVNVVNSATTISYNLNSYNTTTVFKDLDNNVTDQNSKETSYTFKSVCDNTQLLFLIRNIDVEKSKSFLLPTVSTAYDTDKTLSVTNESSLENSKTITYNNSMLNVEVPLNEFSFKIGDQTNSGMKQTTYVQKSAIDNLPYNSLLVTYVQPLIEYGSMQCLGSLVSDLVSVSITND